MRLEDWRHGNEGPTQWRESMTPEYMITGGLARQLDATLFSTLRVRRVGNRPLGTPVVKLFAVVRDTVNPCDPSDDCPRFQHQVTAASDSGKGASPGLGEKRARGGGTERGRERKIIKRGRERECTCVGGGGSVMMVVVVVDSHA